MIWWWKPYTYIFLAPNSTWSFHLVGRWVVWCDFSLTKTNKTCTGLDRQWIVWTQNDQMCLRSLVLDCPWKPLGTLVKRSSSRAWAEQIWCLHGHSNRRKIISTKRMAIVEKCKMITQCGDWTHDHTIKSRALCRTELTRLVKWRCD